MVHQEYIRTVPGSKYAVLMVHGIVGTPEHFRFLLPLIPRDWSVCNLLLDGHGQDVTAFGKTSMKKWKAQVSRQLDDLLSRNEAVIFVAHSMGTLFAIEEAIRRPHAIAGLLLLNVPLYPFVTPAAAVAAVRLALGKVRPQDTIARNMGAAGGVALTPKLWKYLPWAPRFVQLLQECRRIRRRLCLLQVPAAVFQSRHDVLVSQRSNPPLQNHGSITCTVLKHSDHFYYPPEDAQQIRQAFTRLLQRTQAQTE